MTSKSPPVPPANLSNKGPGEGAHSHGTVSARAHLGVTDPSKQGQQANTRINTAPHLSTQDR